MDEHDPVRGVDPDNPFWEFEPGSSGESNVSERADKRDIEYISAFDGDFQTLGFTLVSEAVGHLDA
ncbi:hypothetical protein [Natrinema sp. CBA1119]|uniref:hypothetical protein n=1 Tax=Natrinema sp. CBA1119 TaxID=1608465 RepID=UPI00159BE9A4|nr:hypothetical protein [Natrinema sp. CBA1119]